MTSLCWGLKWGLRRGLLSGLLSTSNGICEVPVGGLSPVEALALFATLRASVSVSLCRQNQAKER